MNIVGVLPYWTLGPWEIGPLTIHSFGLLVAIGLILCFGMASKRGEEKLGLSAEDVQNFGIYLVAIGWFFSHVFEVLWYQPGALREDPLLLFKFWGSISSYGGMLGGVIAFLVWYKRHPKEDPVVWTNLTWWSLPFAWFFGRVGCAMVHDHPGVRAEGFWLWEQIRGVFGDSLPEVWPLALQFSDGPRHDLGFYEAMWWAVIIAFILYKGRKPQRRGYYLWTVPMIYAPMRFMLDFLRVTPDELAYGGDARYLGLTPAHYMSIAVFVAAIVLWVKFRNAPLEEWKRYERPEEDTKGARKKKK